MTNLTDNFNRGAIGSNWTPIFGSGISISGSTVAIAAALGEVGSLYTATSLTNNQSVAGILGGVDTIRFFTLFARGSGSVGTFTGYMGYVGGDRQYGITYWINGTETVLTTGLLPSQHTNGQELKLQCVGSTISLLLNGTTIASVVNTAIVVGGYVGIGFYNDPSASNGATYDNFAATDEGLGGDNIPDQFTFTAQTNVAPKTTITSNAVTISGMDPTELATISVTNGSYSINSGAYVTTSGVVDNGDIVRVRHTSSTSYNTTITTTLVINGISSSFSSTSIASSSVKHPSTKTWVLALNAGRRFSTDAENDQGTVVTNVSQLVAAVDAANSASSAVILVADGTYTLDDTLQITGPNITIRGQSGNYADVIIQGDAMSAGAAVGSVFRVTGVNAKFEDISISRCRWHGIQFAGESGARNPTVSRCRLFNIYQQFIKSTGDASLGTAVTNGIVEDCLLEFTASAAPNYYTGGVDGHACTNWIVRRNTFRNFASPATTLAEHAVHFWRGSSGCIIERNKIENCDRGIGCGIYADGFTTTGHIIKNNIIWHANNGAPYADAGITIEDATSVSVYNNTIHFLNSYPNAIEYRGTTTNAIIRNNLCNKAIQPRDGGTGTVNTNVTNAQNSYYVNATTGDLHLASAVAGVVNAGASIGAVTDDFDGTSRPVGAAYEIGADEYVPSASSQPLIQSDTISYLGSMVIDTAQNSAFDFGGATLAVSGSTLYVSGTVLSGSYTVGRVTIPGSFTGQTVSIISQPLAVPGDPGGLNKRITGALVYNNRLIVQKSAVYDPGNIASGAVFQAGSTTVSGFGSLQGISSSGSHRYYSGFMGHIPTEWQSSFGGPALCGNGPLLSSSTASHGPSCGVFDPDTVGNGTITVTPVIHYTFANPLADANVANNLFSRSDQFISGVVFPTGYRSVLFIGRHGYGTPTYGVDDGGCGGANGEGAAPYRLQVWAYDVDDLIDAKNGIVQPYSVQPYAWWALPQITGCVNMTPGACTYDPVTKRIFLCQLTSQPSNLTIHVYQVP